ncbi:protein Hook homolog 2-like isoform X2 [Zootermopsis nevadensis]|uniref:protein Hook homolog 2-like isoform X2 n=1 Tax=Zootermopsis nevadensis TaxID=136037 RepID=UPI000B8E41E8|nr:protein Hook homolog 2-like isoform X2 [Zootermopsis nevadensis]
MASSKTVSLSKVSWRRPRKCSKSSVELSSNCFSYERQEDEDSDLRALLTEASVSETSMDIELEKTTYGYNGNDLCSFCSLFKQRIKELTANLAVVSAERDVLLKRLNPLNKSIDWLSTENEAQKREIERLRDSEEIADALRTEYAAIKCVLNKLSIGNDRVEISFRDKSHVSAEQLLAMCSEMAKLSAERDSLKTSYEVIAEENGSLKQQPLEILEADGVESRVTVLSKTVESLLSENEDLKQEVKRYSIREVEADILRIECNSIRVKMDELITERNRIQAELCEDLTIEETLLGMRKQIEILSTERDIFKTRCAQVTDVDSCIARQQAQDLRGAGEETIMAVERLKEPVLSQSTEFEETQIQHEKRIVDDSQNLVTKKNVLRLHEQQISDYKQKQLEQNDIIKQMQYENEVMQESIRNLQEEITQISQRERELEETIKYTDSQNKWHLQRIRSLERVISDYKQADVEQNDLITRMEKKNKNMFEYIRRLEYDAIEAKENVLEQENAMKDMQNENKELSDCIKSLKHDNNYYKAKQQVVEEAEMITDMENENGKLMDYVKKLKCDINHAKERDLEKDNIVRDMGNQIKELTDSITAIEEDRTDTDSKPSPHQKAYRIR